MSDSVPQLLGIRTVPKHIDKCFWDLSAMEAVFSLCYAYLVQCIIEWQGSMYKFEVKRY